MKKLLSICVPTYNRASLLQLCLDQICSQMDNYWDQVEVLVSDNCSPDHTSEIMKEFQQKYPLIRYNRHNENLGVDMNLEWCLKNSTGSYTWIFCDDDVLINEKLKLIIDLLERHHPAMMYVSSYSFSDDFEKEFPRKKPLFHRKPVAVVNQRKFVGSVNYFLTFGTGNIFLKDLLPDTYDIAQFRHTHLSQTSWYFTILLQSDNFIKINDKCVAAKVGNSGGYKLFEVFSTNFNALMGYYIRHFSFPAKYKRIIRFHILLSFFPHFVLEYRKNKLRSFVDENPYAILKKEYKRSFWYYLFVFPVMKMPLFLAQFYNGKILRTVNRFIKLFLP